MVYLTAKTAVPPRVVAAIAALAFLASFALADSALAQKAPPVDGQGSPLQKACPAVPPFDAPNSTSALGLRVFESPVNGGGMVLDLEGRFRAVMRLAPVNGAPKLSCSVRPPTDSSASPCADADAGP